MRTHWDLLNGFSFKNLFKLILHVLVAGSCLWDPTKIFVNDPPLWILNGMYRKFQSNL